MASAGQSPAPGVSDGTVAQKTIPRHEKVLLIIASFLKGGLFGAYSPFFTLWMSVKGYSSGQVGMIAAIDVRCFQTFWSVSFVWWQSRSHELLKMWVSSGTFGRHTCLHHIQYKTESVVSKSSFCELLSKGNSLEDSTIDQIYRSSLSINRGSQALSAISRK